MTRKTSKKAGNQQDCDFNYHSLNVEIENVETEHDFIPFYTMCQTYRTISYIL